MKEMPLDQFANEVAAALRNLSRKCDALHQQMESLRENVVALTVLAKKTNGIDHKEWESFVLRCGALIDQELAKVRDGT